MIGQKAILYNEKEATVVGYIEWGTENKPQCIKIPSLASWNHLGTSWCFIDS